MTNVKNYFTKQPQQIVSAWILTGILSLSTGITLLESATAAPKDIFPDATNEMVKGKGRLISDRAHERESDDEFKHERDRNRERSRERGNHLSCSIANTVRRDLSRKLSTPPENLKIINYSRETWSDGCLGLGSLVEQCLQGQVEGWRVTLSDGRSSWVYRTDYEGRFLRLEAQKASANLPKSVAEAVLQDASRRSRLPISELRIVKAERRQWTDGCLGIRRPGVFCTAVIVPGWLVTVEARQKRLVYRTGDFGSGVVLDEAASVISDSDADIKPIQITSVGRG